MTVETFSLAEAASACRVQQGWLESSSWCTARTFHECRFTREALTLEEALRFRACWHTVACARFNSGNVIVDGDSKPIREMDLLELRLPLTLMACAAGLALSKRPDKFRQFEAVLSDRDDLVAMDGNHRLAGLMLRRQKGDPDLVSTVIAYVCR
jgi:hypothetical protein